ncbi:Glycosyl hydrolase family 12 [Phytophthora infestans]|uniref:Glycosyl hydrolase family 12 n=1 Tax=Phytophthora infestans TaxID=4787 RepID=A0A833RQA1_PHYIN|nr:Glycosyl hydrolase family 12 [Phytophthora infestans]
MKFLLPATIALAAATAHAEDFCGSTDEENGKVEVGAYKIVNSNWAVAGKQCTGVDWSETTTIAWHTSYNITGDSDPMYKSFAYADRDLQPYQISSIVTIPTSFDFNYTSDGDMVSNVAYDMFTSWTPAGHPHYELTVWLATYGDIKPKSTTGQPIKTVNVAGVDFDLYFGFNQNINAFSYVAKQPVTSFKGDLKLFFTELPSDNTIPGNQYLQVLRAGTQAFKGTNAKLSVTSYSVSVI